jgi:hypothetical protein
MRRVITAMLMGISFGMFQCKPPDAADDPNLITSLRFAPSAFDSFKRNTELRYSLSGAATVSAYIVRRDSVHIELYIKTLVEDLSETKGSHSITWIGDTDERLFAPAGIYFGVLRVKNQRFETIIQVFHF